MAFKSIGGGIVRLAFGVAALGVAMPVAAEADGMFRIPSLSYASDAEVNSITRTGFIISPDWSLSDELELGGTGGALLEDTDGFAIGGKLGYDWQLGNIVVGGITDAFYSFADGNGRGGAPSSRSSTITAPCAASSAIRSGASWPTGRRATHTASSR